METLTIKIDKWYKDRIKELASEKHTTMQEIIFLMLHEGIAKEVKKLSTKEHTYLNDYIVERDINEAINGTVSHHVKRMIGHCMANEELSSEQEALIILQKEYKEIKENNLNVEQNYFYIDSAIDEMREDYNIKDNMLDTLRSTYNKTIVDAVLEYKINS